MFEEESNEDAESTVFRPTRWKWLSLMPQKMLSRKKGEDEDFDEVLRGMKQLRAELEHIRVSMKAYLKCVEKLSEAAITLGEALETDSAVMAKVNVTMEPLMMDRRFYDSIVRKLSLMDELLNKDTEKLRFIRLSREKAHRKLAALNNKNGQKADKEQKYLKIIEESTREYDELMTHMMAAMSTQVKVVEENGVTELIKRQLQQFKLNQFHLFLNFQRILAGRGDKTANDLEKMWNTFSQEVASTLQPMSKNEEETEEETSQVEDNAERGKFASMLVKQQSFNIDDGEREEEDIFEGFEFDSHETKSVPKYDNQIERPGDLRATLERRRKDMDDDEYSDYS